MNGVPSTKRALTSKAAIWLVVVAGLLLIIGANAHLVYVALTSQSDCVTHLRPGEGSAQSGAFAAAQSDCAPQPNGAE